MCTVYLQMLFGEKGVDHLGVLGCQVNCAFWHIGGQKLHVFPIHTTSSEYTLPTELRNTSPFFLL